MAFRFRYSRCHLVRILGFARRYSRAYSVLHSRQFLLPPGVVYVFFSLNGWPFEQEVFFALPCLPLRTASYWLALGVSQRRLLNRLSAGVSFAWHASIPSGQGPTKARSTSLWTRTDFRCPFLWSVKRSLPLLSAEDLSTRPRRRIPLRSILSSDRTFPWSETSYRSSHPGMGFHDSAASQEIGRAHV